MMIINIAKFLVLMVVTAAFFLIAHSAVRANDDFSLRIVINGEDVLDNETITVDPEREMEIQILIFDVAENIILRELTIEVTFADQTILTHHEPLGDFLLIAPEIYENSMMINTGEVLQSNGQPLVTGIYRTRFAIDYAKGDQALVWDQWRNLKIPGNPLATIPGAFGVATAAGALAAIFALGKSMATTVIPTGSALPSGASVSALTRLLEFVQNRLEPTARGRVTGTMVNAARKRILKEKCPVCETRLKHGHCYTCQKSAKEVRKKYINNLQTYAAEGGQLIASGETVTLSDICARLNINNKTGTDVIAIMKHAKLVKVKGVARKLTGKAVTAGISSAISAIIWVTIGGLVALSAAALIGILIAAIIIPFALTKALQRKARREIKRISKKTNPDIGENNET